MYAARAFSCLIVNSHTEAWHVVTTVDAFLDSDEEDIDEPARQAYGASWPLPPFHVRGPIHT
jgi:hypothetical protein